MKNIIEFEDVTISYQEKELFKNVSWSVKENSYTTLCGKNGCGKTSLMKALLGLIPYEGTITIDKEILTSKTRKEILSKIGVVFENPNTNLICETVIDDFKITLKNLGYSKKEIEERIEEISSELKIESLLSKLTTHLSGGEKQLASLALALLKKPKILILDEAFTMLDGVTKEKMIKYIKKYKQKNKITIIQVTHEADDILYGNYVAIVDENKIVYDKVEKMLKQESLFKQAKLDLPFMADLSNKLKYYDLLEDAIYDLDKMVNYLWK